MKSGIYKITNTVNGKIYVGSAANILNRWAQHKGLLVRGKHHSIKLQRSWDKHGQDCFEFSVLLYAPIEDLIHIEQTWMDREKPFYNIAPMAGTRRGLALREETKAKMSAARIGKKPNSETRTKMSAWQLGKTRSADICRKISESKKAAQLKGRPAWNKGIPHTPETRAKMSATQRMNRPGGKA